MANLSQIRRNRLLVFINQLREQHKTEDDIMLALGEIENELTSKKYGLIWEQHEEEVNVQMRKNIPVFEEWAEKGINTGLSQKYNFILEGDNLHSLHLLEKTHLNAIDVIYIDPPYNTENSLTYDDERVGDDDAFRHSKWVSFMNERIRIARKLMKPTGLFMASIDDNEAYSLKLLLDEIFGEENCMGVFAVIKAEGGGMAKYIVKGHDLVLVYAKNLQLAKPLAREKDIRGKIVTIDNVQYWIQEDAIRETFGQYGHLYYEDILEKRSQEYKDQIDAGIKNKEYLLVEKGNGKHIIGKLRRVDEDYSKFYSVIKHLNADGVQTLETMGLAGDFDYPKPVSLLKELIKGATFFSKEPPVILDFFAGSGTTGQAVLELNQEDGKNRTFILCTNNEVSAKNKLKFVQRFGILPDFVPTKQTSNNAIEKKIFASFSDGEKGFYNLVAENKELYESLGICQHVTYQRIANIINGYDSAAPDKQILFEKKITASNYEDGPLFKQKIDEIIEKGNFDDYSVHFTNDAKLQLLGKTNEYHHFDPIPANLMYYRTGFVSKNEDFLSESLLEHISEMIQLEHGIKIDGKNYCVILNDDAADELENHWSEYSQLKGIYVSRSVLFSTKQKKLFSSVKQHIIPDYYFRFELNEVGESW